MAHGGLKRIYWFLRSLTQVRQWRITGPASYRSRCESLFYLWVQRHKHGERTGDKFIVVRQYSRVKGKIEVTQPSLRGLTLNFEDGIEDIWCRFNKNNYQTYACQIIVHGK
jgi:hypothetical protein